MKIKIQSKIVKVEENNKMKDYMFNTVKHHDYV
jgi:hypothetical protein